MAVKNNVALEGLIRQTVKKTTGTAMDGALKQAQASTKPAPPPPIKKK